MKKVSIIFGSTTGNTERVAELIKEKLEGHETSLVNVTDINDDIINSSDILLFGSSTWGYGELQDDFQSYYDTMDEKLKNKKVAIFGCGDEENYSDVFCKAVDLIEEKVIENGGEIITESLKVDGEIEDNIDEIESFSKAII